MACDDISLVIDQHWDIEAEGLNARSNLVDLSLIVLTRIKRVEPKGVYWVMSDLQPPLGRAWISSPLAIRTVRRRN